MRLIPTPDGKRFEKYLDALQQAEIVLRPTCTAAQVKQWVNALPQKLADAVVFCFLLGQRLGDVLQLERRSFKT